jgi:hypothetical protein
MYVMRERQYSTYLSAFSFYLPLHVYVEQNGFNCLGGVAQGTFHLPQEQKTRVQIPPGCKGLGKNIIMLTTIKNKQNVAMQLCVIDLICIHCVLKKIVEALALNF